MEFEGFSSEMIDFLWELKLNNNKEFMEKNRQRYKDVLKDPFDAFSAELGGKFVKVMNRDMDWHISRINRDIRFSKDKSPYRACRWVSFMETTIKNSDAGTQRPAFYFELNTDGYSYGMGFYGATSAYLAQYRKKIDSNPAALKRIINKMEKLEGYEFFGDSFKRMKVPEEYDAKVAEWYVKKSVGLTKSCALDDVFFSADLVDKILEGFADTMPLYNYLLDIKVE